MYAQAIVTFGLATLASAHMKMSSPVPYGASSLDNGPLDASGKDFPCKQRATVYDAEGASNVYAQGAGGKLAFIGSAVHGGGSCQVSITYDAKPDKNSVWKVIKSIEGGCPAKNAAGNLGDNANQQNQDTYDFTIPTDMPAGNGTIAWTWFNKIGNREMYMNCGPVTITGSAGSQSAYEALPDMFTANIGNDCATLESKDVQFPNPGTSVDKFGDAQLLSPPDGKGCQAGSGGGSGGGSTGSPAPTSTAGNGGGVQPTTAPTTAPAVSQPAASSKPSASIPGGVFITVPNGSGSTPTASATASVSKAPAATAAPSAAPSSGTGSGSGSGNGTETGAGAQTVGAACTDEGAWNCIGGTSYQRCASGAWSAVQQLASGTSCTAGMGSSINMVVTRNGRKRALRFRSHA